MNQPKAVNANKKNASSPNKKSDNSDPIDIPSSEEQLFAIRNLLFGEQVKQLENQIHEQDIKFTERLDRIEALMIKNHEAVNEEINAASQRIANDIESNRVEHVSQESILEDKLSSLTDRLSAFQELTDNNLEDARHALNHTADEINKSLQREVEQLTLKLNAASTELSTNKADRKTLANLLESMASNLTESQA